MQHQSQMRYPAPVEVVMRMFTDAGFHAHKLDALGLSSYRILEQQLDGADFRIRVQRKVPLRVPAMLRKFLPAVATAVHEECWNTHSRTGIILVEPQGMPLALSCATAIRAMDGSSIVHFDWIIRARIPLLGEPLERFIASDIDRHAAEETRIAIGLLEHYR